MADVIDALNEALAAKLFPARNDGGDPRVCPLCGNGRLSLKLGRFGAFVGCSNYPECRYTRRFGDEAGEEDQAPRSGCSASIATATRRSGSRSAASVPTSSAAAARRSSAAPCRRPWPRTRSTSNWRSRLLALPREVGRHPESGEPVQAGIGRYGPYVSCGRLYANLEDDDDVLALGMNRAVELLSRRSRSAARAAVAAATSPLEGARSASG